MFAFQYVSTFQCSHVHVIRTSPCRRVCTYACKRVCNLATVPVIVCGSKDPLDILEALIEANRQGQKTNEQIGREAVALLEIEEKRANERQLATQNNKTGRAVRESVPPPKKDHGKPRDAVGHKIGVRGKTTKQSAVAVKVMDELAAKGKQREATQNSSIIPRLIPG